MRAVAHVVIVSVAALLASRTRAQDADPARLFPRELDVQAPSTVSRLALPAAVLAAVRPDLSDIRLYDGDVEVPYFSDSGARPWPTAPALPRTPVTPLDATRRADHTGIVETYVLPPPPPPPPHAHWALELDTGVPEYVRALRIEAAGDPAPMVETSVFRFAFPLRERSVVTLPIAPATQLNVVVTGQPDGLLPPPPLAAAFAYVAVAGPVDPPRLAVPLAELSRRRDGGRTIVTLACPPGVRPDVLRIETTTASFARDVHVFAAGSEAGSASVYRVDLPSLRDAAVLEVGLDRFTGDRLEVHVGDGDSPPLAGLRFVAELRQPAIVFDGTGAVLILRYGGGRARAPHYDLATLTGLEGDRLLAAEDLAEAEAGASRASPTFDAAPALAFLAQPGVHVDATRMTWSSDVTIDEAREGVATLRVPAGIAAAARADLGDLRIVGRDDRQFPYLLDERGGHVDLPLAVGAPAPENGETVYTLGLPVTRATLEGLRIDVDARFTERPFVVRARDDDEVDVVLASDLLRRAPGEAGPIVVRLSGVRVHDVVLAVEDGDDAPLRIRSIVAEAAVPTLVLAAPRGRYRMLVGDAALTPPVYEMSRGRALIDAVPLADAVVARPARNGAFREPGFFERAGAGAISLWAALLFAVLVLGFVTLRVARADEPVATAPAATPDAPVATPDAAAATTDAPAAETPPDTPDTPPSPPDTPG